MKKFVLILVCFIFFISACFAKSGDKSDVKSGSFRELGRYSETFELNEPIDKSEEEYREFYDDFEDEAIREVARRYEENAVELKLDNINDYSGAAGGIGVFKLKVNESQYVIENNIKTENMIWDGSKSFSQAFINNSRHLAPIPSVINSSKLTADVSKSVTASLGQTYLYNSIGTPVLFVRANESSYNTGSVLSYKGSSLNLSAGSFTSSYNHESSGGVMLSSKPVNLPKNTGSFSLGGAFIANEQQDYDKNTGGLFAEYTFKRLKLNVQAGQSRYSNSNICDTSLYFAPELKISNSLTLKTRFIRNVTQDTMQDEFVLNFKPKKNNNNLEIELSTINKYTDNAGGNQKIKFAASFKI